VKPVIDKTQIWKDKVTGLRFCDAFYCKHVSPKHAHDYYVIGAITEGNQIFFHKGKEYYTPRTE